MVSGLVQLALGVSGMGGWIAQRCGPMVLAPSLSIIGLSAYKEAAHFCSDSWGVALLYVSLGGPAEPPGHTHTGVLVQSLPVGGAMGSCVRGTPRYCIPSRRH